MAVPWSIADLVHDLSDVAEQFGVRSIPTIVLALRGREINRIAGARSEADLIGWVLRQQAVVASSYPTMGAHMR